MLKQIIANDVEQVRDFIVTHCELMAASCDSKRASYQRKNFRMRAEYRVMSSTYLALARELRDAKIVTSSEE